MADERAAFLTPLRTEKIGPQRWLLIDDCVFHSLHLRGDVIAPRGFQTDFASIPRPLWVLFPPVDRYDPAAVIHDAAYGNALVTAHGDRIFTGKRIADGLFLEALGACEVNTIKRRLMFAMVTVFGDPVGHPLAANRGV